MLILKKNILNLNSKIPFGFPDEKEYPPAFNPNDLLEAALREEENRVYFFLKKSIRFSEKDSRKFYPNAYKIGDIKLIRNFINILLEGLICRTRWFRMNTYHFCILYDILLRYIFNYNHCEEHERLKIHPKWEKCPISFEKFIEDYYFNSVFLITPEKYNVMTPDEKKIRGFICPCQFSVINGLRPTKEEMQLKESKNFPYTLYV